MLFLFTPNLGNVIPGPPRPLRPLDLHFSMFGSLPESIAGDLFTAVASRSAVNVTLARAMRFATAFNEKHWTIHFRPNVTAEDFLPFARVMAWRERIANETGNRDLAAGPVPDRVVEAAFCRGHPNYQKPPLGCGLARSNELAALKKVLGVVR